MNSSQWYLDRSLSRQNCLLYVLALYGMNIGSIPLSRLERCVSYFYIAAVHISAVYTSSIFLSAVRRREDLKKGFAYFLATAFSIGLWYSVILAKKPIARVTQKIYHTRWGVPKRPSTALKCYLVAIVGSTYVATAVMMSLSNAFYKPVRGFWTYGHVVRDKTLNNLFFTAGNWLLYLSHITVPSLVTAYAAALLGRLSRTLGQYAVRLEKLTRVEDEGERARILGTFFVLSRLSRELASILDVPTLFVITISFSAMFTSIEYFISGGLDSVSIAFETLLLFASSCANLLAIALCSSALPRRLADIRTTSAGIVDRLTLASFSSPRDDKMVPLLRRIESEDLVYITACGMVRLDRSFVLSAFGTLFTYSMLILSIRYDKI